MPYLDRTTEKLHRRWPCVRWNARRHGHDVEEIDSEDVPEWAEPCGNCLSGAMAQHLYGLEVAR